MISRLAPNLPLRAKLAVQVAALSLLLLAVLAVIHRYGQGLGFWPCGLAILLAGAGFYRLLAKTVAAPLERLLREVDRVRSGHEAAEPAWLEMESRDEVGRLAAMVNDMNHSFFEARQRLQEKVNVANSALVSTVEQLQQRSSEPNQRTAELEAGSNIPARSRSPRQFGEGFEMKRFMSCSSSVTRKALPPSSMP